MLLVMRVLQGIGGGALAPISQAILMESFPPRKQGIAQALFGLGVVVAPVVGPVLGGWLTDSYSWRWIFYINIPFGLMAMWAIQQTVEDPPWVRDSNPGPLDTLGLVALSLWLGCQEIFLDKGQEDDWFGSQFIRLMAVLAVSGFLVFVWRELRAEKPMVDLRLFAVRNFCRLHRSHLSHLCAHLQHRPAHSAVPATAPGLFIPGVGHRHRAAWRGRGHFHGPGRRDGAQDRSARLMLVFGFLVLRACRLSVCRKSISAINAWTVFWPQILAGSAMGFLFVPVNYPGTAPLRRDQIGSATGTMSLMRNVGGSVGIAWVSTLLARRSQVHQTMLGEHLTSDNLLLLQDLRGMRGFLSIQCASFGNGAPQALAAVYRILQQQAYLMAFRDVFQDLVLISLAAILLVFMLRETKKRPRRPLTASQNTRGSEYSELKPEALRLAHCVIAAAVEGRRSGSYCRRPPPVVTATVMVRCSRNSAASPTDFRLLAARHCVHASPPAPPPATAPMAAPLPPPAIAPMIAPRAAPPPDFSKVFLPRPSAVLL